MARTAGMELFPVQEVIDMDNKNRNEWKKNGDFPAALASVVREALLYNLVLFEDSVTIGIGSIEHLSEVAEDDEERDQIPHAARLIVRTAVARVVYASFGKFPDYKKNLPDGEEERSLIDSLTEEIHQRVS